MYIASKLAESFSNHMIKSYQRKPEVPASHPCLRQRLILGLQNYGGFLLGAFTVPILFAYLEPIGDWVDQLDHGSGYFPTDWWWAPLILSSMLSNFLFTLIMFGPCVFLGGLLGRHPLRSGLLVCFALLTIVLIVLHSIMGSPKFQDHWLHYVTFPLSYLAFYLGATIPYLFGFSLKSLAILFVSSPS